ncbi:hypothetical protein TI10_15195 [Photorhabdus luminescens subsp. luminescens]|uniref:Uncharacterized protein n=1 Tax=Photorhabdus luminescens TaxID=29488 RepID=A0A1G5RF68_PHOLU|nr:hypothetical protein [Photorhabdus luminescens]KMW72313.1 hypothetical protein TI10_15195 [Photorhabdus luminescens subsp. luminescens]SCZ72772.1 hypothetical protein SAMN02982990_04117 [Photorhabdus luminescens]
MLKMIKLMVFILSFLFSIHALACGEVNRDILNRNSPDQHYQQAINSDRLANNSALLFFYSNKNEDYPDVKAFFSPDRCNINNGVFFDSYGYNAGIADVISVFWGKGKYTDRFFTIIKWNVNAGGSPSYGWYYMVNAYFFPGQDNLIKKDEKLTSYFGQGIEGISNGEISHFKYKTASDVWKALEWVD